MSDRHGEPVEVLRHFADPAHFIWHGRLYIVRDVVAHWAEVDQWWRAALTRVLDCPRPRAGAVGDDAGEDQPGECGGGRRVLAPAAGPARTGAAPTGPAPANRVELAPTAGSDWVVTDQTEITILPHMRSPARGELGGAGRPLAGRLGYAAVASRGHRYGAGRRASGDLDVQYEFWRVSAGLGRSGVPWVFDLCQDLGTGQWTLSRGDAGSASDAGSAAAGAETTDSSLS
jgi:hypothetical protein